VRTFKGKNATFMIEIQHPTTSTMTNASHSEDVGKCPPAGWEIIATATTWANVPLQGGK